MREGERERENELKRNEKEIKFEKNDDAKRAIATERYQIANGFRIHIACLWLVSTAYHM